MKAWQKGLGAESSNGDVKKNDGDLKESNFFTQQFFTEITDADYKKSDNNFTAPIAGIPSVAYIEDGEEKYAHIFDPSIPFGTLHPKNNQKKVQEASELDDLNNDVSLTLSYRSVLEPRNEKELLVGKWSLKDLIGSTVSLQFLNNMDFKKQVTSTISQISSFTPCFSFQKIGEDKKYMEDLTFMGEPINLSAKEVLKKQNINTNLANLKQLSLPANTDKVEYLKINVISNLFPQALLEIFPTDTNGNVVEGLTASNFVLTDNENPVIGILEQNVVAPNVVVLYDISGSMPVKYREEGHMQEFTRELENLVQEFYPHAKITAQATGSDIYTSLLRAKQSDFDLIMYATDGDNDDLFDPQYLEVYESGQPMVILEVIPKHPTYDELKKNISNLISISALDREALKLEIKKTLSELSFPPYVMNFNSFGEDLEHTLKVKLNDKNIIGETTFRFPTQNDLFLGDRMMGLYLTIKSKNTEVRRTLAGWDNQVDYFERSRAHVDEVHEMMLGGATIAFEGEAPSLSIRLSEYLTALISNEKWFNAHREGDVENAVKYLEEGSLSYPSMLLTMMQTPSDALDKETITFPRGFRSCIIKTKPALYSTQSLVSFDYLPTSDYSTVSKSGDGKTNFQETLKKTMQFAVLEAKMFQDSTIQQLKNKKLIHLEKAKKDPRFNYTIMKEKNPVFSERIFSESDLTFFDDSLSSTAYFTIDNYTGELFANLPDGTGGGGNSVEIQLQEVQRVVDAYQQLISALQLGMSVPGVGTFPLGVVAAYSVTLVQLYAHVSEALIIMDASNLDDDVKLAMVRLACNVHKSITFLSLGPLGSGMTFIENLIGLMGGSFAFGKC